MCSPISDRNTIKEQAGIVTKELKRILGTLLEAAGWILVSYSAQTVEKSDAGYGQHVLRMHAIQLK